MLSLFQPAVSWQRLLTMEILQLPALWSSCHSRPCQLNYSAMSPQQHLQSSAELPTLNKLDCPSSLLYNHFAWITSKTPFFYRCVRVRSRGNVFTQPFLRNGRLFIRLLHSKGCTRCLFRSLCLATGLCATIFAQDFSSIRLATRAMTYSELFVGQMDFTKYVYKVGELWGPCVTLEVKYDMLIGKCLLHEA
jgi:hypothetical protein